MAQNNNEPTAHQKWEQRQAAKDAQSAAQRGQAIASRPESIDEGQLRSLLSQKFVASEITLDQLVTAGIDNNRAKKIFRNVAGVSFRPAEQTALLALAMA